jgi:Family of unknown function (DUF6221)
MGAMSADETPVAWLRAEIAGDLARARHILDKRGTWPEPRREMHDAIADCEAKSAILDECEKALQVARTYRDGDGVLALACAKTWLDAVRLLASAYRHRPGYPEGDWEP